MNLNPIPFKRGATFSFLVTIPATVSDGYFAGWEIEAQLRQAKNDSDRGLISRLAARWENSSKTRKLILSDDMTDRWPLGAAEMDVLFTSPSGFRTRSKTIIFNIERGITR